MKKRKTKKLAFLFLLSPLTLGGLASCGTTTPEPKPIEVKSSNVKVKEGITNGTVSATLTGTLNVGSEVTIIAIPNEGYEVDKYYLNDKVLEGSTFNTVEGDNIVSATFKASPQKEEFGSVQIITDSIINGSVEAKLEDGTLIEESNRRQPVGTKIILSFTPLNECYEIKEVKLNETTLELKEGACEFLVVKGKNFISATFGLSQPGKGLIKLEKEVSNAEVNISNLGEYVAVNTDVTIKVTPALNYTVKTVKVNGKVLTESETENTFVFKVAEGLNSIEIEIVSIANGISIVIPEDWFFDDQYSSKRYYVTVGDQFKLDVKFEPEGAYDDLIWSLSYDDDAKFVEVKEDGTIKVLQENRNPVTVKVSLKSNPDTSDTINLLPVSSAEYGVAKLRHDFKLEKETESEKVSKSNVIVEKANTSKGESSKLTYDFEAFNDGHSLTKVTDSKGMNTFFYRTIKDNTFYSLYRDNSGDRAVEEPTKVTESNKEELQNRVNAFGGIEFIESDLGVKYNGSLDYIYQTIFGEYSIYKESDEEERKAIYDGTIVKYSSDGYELTTNYVYKDFIGDFFKAEIKLNLNYDYFYERINSATFQRKDYSLESETDKITETTPYELEKIEVKLTYGEKGEDTSNLFNLDDYLLKDFNPIIYTDRDKIAETTLAPNKDGKLELKVDTTYYIDINKLVPGTALDEFNELKVESSNKEVISYVSSTSNKAKFYFEPSKAGEATLTFTIGSIKKTVDVVASYVPIEKVEFATTQDSAFIGEKIQLKANVLPSEGIENDEVKYSIKEGTNTCEATIIEDVGSYSTLYYLTSAKAGTVTVIATSVADPTKTSEKTFTFKETPNILGELSGKTYGANWSEFNMSNYRYDEYSYKIEFGEGATTAKVTLTKSAEDYNGDVTTTKGSYSANVKQEGTSLILSDFVDLDASTIPSTELPTLSATISIEGKLDKINLDFGGTKKELKEVIDVLPTLKDRIFEGEDLGDVLTLSFSEAEGKITCKIKFVTGSSTKTTHEFTANVLQNGDKIKLENIVPITEGSASSDLPTTIFSYQVASGKVTSLSYSSYYSDVTLKEVL